MFFINIKCVAEVVREAQLWRPPLPPHDVKCGFVGLGGFKVQFFTDPKLGGLLTE